MNQLLIFNPNNFMEKRKARNSCIIDELALAKSAAWAWLEHRSGSDERSTPEFDVSRSKFNPKPSRYKVEAMKRRSSSSNSSRTIDGSLLDRYEIERISRQLHLCLKPSHADHHGGRRVVEEEEEDVKRKPAQKKKMSKGFSLLGLINEAMYSTRRRRRPVNGRVAVVEVGCRPWQGIRA